MRLSIRHLAWLPLLAALAAPAPAHAVHISLLPLVNGTALLPAVQYPELTLAPDTELTVVVDIDGEGKRRQIRGYNLDISYDRTVLEFLGATQLASLFDQDAGERIAPSFSVSPTTDLREGNRGRASLLSVELDLDLDQPQASRRNGLFQLRFKVLPGLGDDNDLEIGFLDPRANAIIPPEGGVLPNVSNAVLNVVPEPSTALLLAAGLSALAAQRRRTYIP